MYFPVQITGMVRSCATRGAVNANSEEQIDKVNLHGMRRHCKVQITIVEIEDPPEEDVLVQWSKIPRAEAVVVNADHGTRDSLYRNREAETQAHDAERRRYWFSDRAHLPTASNKDEYDPIVNDGARKDVRHEDNRKNESCGDHEIGNRHEQRALGFVERCVYGHNDGLLEVISLKPTILDYGNLDA
jgi:hypothetical protein